MKRPIRKPKELIITHKTKVKEIFNLNAEKTKTIIKQMEAYGLQVIGYGIDHNKTLEKHANEQSLSNQRFRLMLKSINRKL